MDNGLTIRSGLGFGTALAMIISWSINTSIVWAVLHGFFGWLYVFYYAVTSGTFFDMFVSFLVVIIIVVFLLLKK